MRGINRTERGNPSPQTGANYYHARVNYKGHAIQGLFVCSIARINDLSDGSLDKRIVVGMSIEPKYRNNP